MSDSTAGTAGAPHGRGGVDPVPALVRQLQDVEERLDATGRAVQEIAGELEALAKELRSERGPRVVCWADLDAEAAREAWAELASWIAEVLLPHYELSNRELPRCWYRHPPVVEALGWLHTSWLAAYRTKNANPALAAEWQSRRLPDAVKIVEKHAKRCDSGHKEQYGGIDPVLDDEAAFAEHVDADAGERARRAALAEPEQTERL